MVDIKSKIFYLRIDFYEEIDSKIMEKVIPTLLESEFGDKVATIQTTCNPENLNPPWESAYKNA